MNLDQILNQKTINRYRDYFKPSQLEGSQPSTNPLTSLYQRYSASRIGSYLKEGRKIAVANQELLLVNLSSKQSENQYKSNNSQSATNFSSGEKIIQSHSDNSNNLIDKYKYIIVCNILNVNCHQESDTNPAKNQPAARSLEKDESTFNFESSRNSLISAHHINFQSIVSIYES